MEHGSAHDPQQAARREFIRTHHPDRGGDVAAFVAGLARFDRAPVTQAVRITVTKRRSWPSRVLAALGLHHRPGPRVH